MEKQIFRTQVRNKNEVLEPYLRINPVTCRGEDLSLLVQKGEKKKKKKSQKKNTTYFFHSTKEKFQMLVRKTASTNVTVNVPLG